MLGLTIVFKAKIRVESMLLSSKSSPKNVKALVKKKRDNPSGNEFEEEESDVNIQEEECVM